MAKYIDAEKLKAEIERLNSLVSYESKDRHDEGLHDAYKAVKNVIASLQQETSEINLEEFTEKIEDWKARFSYPDSIPVKATMAFTARMFYMYPDVAREWYASLPKVTQD